MGHRRKNKGNQKVEPHVKEHTIYQNLWNAAKTVFGDTHISKCLYYRK